MMSKLYLEKKNMVQVDSKCWRKATDSRTNTEVDLLHFVVFTNLSKPRAPR